LETERIGIKMKLKLEFISFFESYYISVKQNFYPIFITSKSIIFGSNIIVICVSRVREGDILWGGG